MKALFTLITLAISLELFAMNLNEHFSLNQDYYALTADEKREYLWQNIIKSRHKTLPALSWQGWPFFYKDFDRFMKGNRGTTDDVRLARQTRVMFAQGTVAKVRYISTYSGYDGIFAGDALALMRCSLFADPEAIGSYIPFVTLRFLNR